VEEGEGVGDAGLGHADDGPHEVGVEAEAEGGEFVGVGVLGEDALGEDGGGEEGVVGVLAVVGVEEGIGGGFVAALFLVVGVAVGAEDGAEVFEGLLGTVLGVEEVEDGEVDEVVAARKDGAEGGGVGPENHEVVAEVLADQDVGVLEPAGKEEFMPLTGPEGEAVELEEKGWTRTKRGELGRGQIEDRARGGGRWSRP
jgi:hypothetical protein